MNIDEENVKLNLFEKLSVLSTDMEDLLSNITSRSQGEIRFQIKAAKDESTMHNSPEIDYVLTLFCLLNDEITENYINKESKVIGTSVRQATYLLVKKCAVVTVSYLCRVDTKELVRLCS